MYGEDLIVSQITSFEGETKHPSSAIPEKRKGATMEPFERFPTNESHVCNAQ